MNRKRRINGETLYQIFLRPFTSEGTIAAAEKQLPEVADLGVKILYLCPVAVADDDMAQENWSPRQIASGCNNPRNPYRISDYTKIDPEYGTEDDMKSFIRTAHSLGMKVLPDLVYCHAGPSFLKDHPGFAKGLTEYRFPELDFSNPAVCEYLLDNMRFYAFELDADGFRCDMGDKVPLDFWQSAVEELRKIKPDLIMFCEGIPQREDELQLGVFDLYYNWGWSQIRHEILRTGAEKVSAITGPMLTNYPCARYFENHDFANDCYESRIEKVVGAEGIEALLFMDFMLDGVPFLYNGVEFCDTARHSIFANPREFAIDRSGNAEERRNFIKTLTQLRLNTPELYQEPVESARVENDVLRVHRGGKIFCFVNLGQREQEIAIPAGMDIFLKSKMSQQFENKVILPKFGFAAFQRKEKE